MCIFILVGAKAHSVFNVAVSTRTHSVRCNNPSSEAFADRDLPRKGFVSALYGAYRLNSPSKNNMPVAVVSNFSITTALSFTFDLEGM
jgi:hypothetical protein